MKFRPGGLSEWRLSRLARAKDERIDVSDHEGHCWPLEICGFEDEVACTVVSAGEGRDVKGSPEGDWMGKSPCWGSSCNSFRLFFQAK